MPDAAGSPASARLGQAVATPTSSSSSSSSAATPTGSTEDARASRKRASMTAVGVGGRSRRSSRHSSELAAYYDFSKRRSVSVSVQDEPGAIRLVEALVMRDEGSNVLVGVWIGFCRCFWLAQSGCPVHHSSS